MLKLASFAALSMMATPAFAQTLSVQGLLYFLIALVVIGLALWVIWWAIGYLGVPEPINKVLRVIVALIGVLILIYLLMGLLGGGAAIVWD